MIADTGYNTVDEYIALQPETVQENLVIIRNIIKTTVPEALETISYQMPAFKYHGMLCFFAVFKDHYSLFVSPGTREAFSAMLTTYKTTKSAIHFPKGKTLPVDLIEEIIRFAADRNLQKAEAKKSNKKR
jgi:uncharacterized protein YdhG (YjbR/CyaY superfamily)